MEPYRKREVEDLSRRDRRKKINGRAIARDREGGLWIGTSGEGIVHLHDGRVDHFSSFDGLSSDFAQSIFQDREGNVWVLSENGAPAISGILVAPFRGTDGSIGATERQPR